MKIGFIGKAGSGKDTAAQMLVRVFGFERVAFADPIKEMVHVGLGIPREVLWGPDEVKARPDPYWDVSVRSILQTLGTQWGRTYVHPDIWIRIALDRQIPKRESEGQAHFVVSDVRFLNEAALLRAAGFTLVKIVRPGYGDGCADTHQSETEMEQIEADVVVTNDGTIEDLELKVSTAVPGLAPAPK